MYILSKVSPSTGPGSPGVVGFYEPVAGSCRYIVICEEKRKAALIDVVVNFDAASARTSTEHAEWALNYLDREGLELEWILDTYPQRRSPHGVRLAQCADSPAGGYRREGARDCRALA